MNYKNAAQVLPDELLKEVQKYAAGEAIYIPKNEEKKKWGEGSGARSFYTKRNAEIQKAYNNGVSLEILAGQYGLAIETLRKIVYKNSTKR